MKFNSVTIMGWVGIANSILHRVTSSLFYEASMQARELEQAREDGKSDLDTINEQDANTRGDSENKQMGESHDEERIRSNNTLLMEVYWGITRKVEEELKAMSQQEKAGFRPPCDFDFMMSMFTEEQGFDANAPRIKAQVKAAADNGVDKDAVLKKMRDNHNNENGLRRYRAGMKELVRAELEGFHKDNCDITAFDQLQPWEKEMFTDKYLTSLRNHIADDYANFRNNNPDVQSRHMLINDEIQQVEGNTPVVDDTEAA